MMVELAKIKVGKNYSRTHGIGDITELVDSMREHGLIQPISVDRDHNLIAGFRRVAAAVELGWVEIPATWYYGENPKQANLVENMNRESLTLWEEIQAIRDVFGSEASQGEIARALSKSRPWVEPRVKIWELPSEFIDRVRLGVAGVSEIKKRLRGRTGKNTATSKASGTPSQQQIKTIITELLLAEREAEAKALSYAIGGCKVEDLFPESD